MPVRSLRSSVLKWPDRESVEEWRAMQREGRLGRRSLRLLVRGRIRKSVLL